MVIEIIPAFIPGTGKKTPYGVEKPTKRSKRLILVHKVEGGKYATVLEMTKDGSEITNSGPFQIDRKTGEILVDAVHYTRIISPVEIHAIAMKTSVTRLFGRLEVKL